MYSIEWKHSRRSDVTANTRRRRRRRTGLMEEETGETGGAAAVPVMLTETDRDRGRQRVIRLQ